jgi:hypothetical protein
MSKKDDFFEVAPPQGHANRVMKAVSGELEKRKAPVWQRWGILTSALAGGLALWFSQRPNADDLEITEFESVSAEDVELLALEDSDLIEMLEDLESLEEEV